jgi:hypothetical protein
MITKNFQKLGALVASLVSILTLSSAAEAITVAGTTITGSLISSPNAVTNIGATTATGRTKTISTSAYSTATPLLFQSFNDLTIKGLNLSTNGRRLSATLSLIDSMQNVIGEPVALFTSTSGTGASIATGDYTFSTTLGTVAWPTNGSSYSSSTTYALNPAGFTQFIGTDVSGTQWQLDLTNGVSSSMTNGTGSLTGFSVDATVPFDSNAAPAGVAIVVSAFVLRRKLQQRSARMMSLESVNS